MSSTNVHSVITKAISAHGMWKQRLRQAVTTGHSEWDPGTVRVDNQCDLGKWLYGEAAHWFSNDPCIENVRTLHAEFHREAARVLELALTGNRTEAEQAIGLGSPYSRVSATLVRALQELDAA